MRGRAIGIGAAALLVTFGGALKLEGDAATFREEERVACVEAALEAVDLDGARYCNERWASEWSDLGSEERWRECVRTATGGDLSLQACDLLWGDQWTMSGEPR